ncbi:MAG TPA: 4Fe-4S dicluster domain-containing protein [Thermoplasmata archaeon]|nr:4Fe-4S dicluster domain-containing protein [Thermoplasmata archaeon]
MSSDGVRIGDRLRLDRKEFPTFLAAVRGAGYRIVGPTVRDGAIVYGDIAQESDLPIGWTDRQGPGSYRLEKRDDAALFGYAVGPHSWKKYLFPSHERLWTATRKDGGFSVAPEPLDGGPIAFLGVRACEMAAIAIQDRVFAMANDPGYAARRRRTLRIAVQCGVARGTCFCVSMGTGPGVRGDFDLALTEVVGPGEHYFSVEVGSASGAAVLAPVPLRPTTVHEQGAAADVVAKTAASMGRTMDTTGIRDLLVDNPEHPRWEIVASRCLACTNCTLACPTCFCSTSEEVPDLSQEKVERWRRWDSCFTSGFSDLHASPVRKTQLARYRQWMTHKLATWHDQFGSSGCVGCGRCITWCPVGIDLTEEVAAIRATPGARRAPGGAR